MIISKIQHELIKLGVTYRGYELLSYMKEKMFTDIKGVDLQNMRPMYFKDAKDVRHAYDELTTAELIQAKYSSGNISSIAPNIEKILNTSDISSGITIEKKAVSRKKKKDDIPDNIKDIFLYYNSFATLPRPSTPTPLAISRIEDKLTIFSPEQIKDALQFASEAEWLVNKGSEVWCNLGWVMLNIDKFMIGGKYRKSSSSNEIDTYSKYKIESDNCEIIL